MVQNKQAIKEALLSHRLELEGFGVRRLGLFGSFAKGCQKDSSDIDLLVEFAQGQKSFRNFMKLAFFLEDLFLRRVEVVTPESLSPYLKPAVLREIEYVIH